MAKIPTDPLGDILRDLDATEEATATVTTDHRRYGKAITIIDGLEGRRDLSELAKDLKQRLATGGAVKAGRIELQGDHRRRAIDMLQPYGIQVNP